MPRKLRVFLDTSAVLAGLNSPTGAAGTILAACFAHQVIPIVSPQVIEEAERNIPAKFLDLDSAWKAFLLIPPEVTPRPAIREIRKAYKLLPTSDAPILASAIKAKPDALVTWDKDFFNDAIGHAIPFSILLPGEFLKLLK